ncbi:oligosaccharide flippase family protein [bacterium]|nr:oligosaccharide flippase family protein [bacterium]
MALLPQKFKQALEGNQFYIKMKNVTGYTALLRIFGILLLLGLQYIIVKKCGEDNFGKYAYYLSVLNILVIFSRLGLDNASIKYIALYSKNKDYKLLKSYIKYGMAKIFICATIVTTIILLNYFTLNNLNFTNYNVLIFITMLYVLSLNQFFEGCLRGKKQFIKAIFPTSVLLPVVATLSVIIYGKKIDSAIISIPLLSHITAIIIVLMYLFYQLKVNLLNTPLSITKIKNNYKTQKKSWLNTSIGLMLISGCHIILGNTDIIMIGNLIDMKNAGIYTLAVRFSTFITFGINIISSISGPYIAELYRESKKKDLEKLLHTCSYFATVWALLVLLFITIFGDNILQIYFDDYNKAYKVTIILCVGQLFASCFGLSVTLLKMCGYEKFLAMIMGAASLLNIPLNYLLITKHGVIGASIATSIIFVLYSIAILAFVRKKFKFWPMSVNLNSLNNR